MYEAYLHYNLCANQDNHRFKLNILYSNRQKVKKTLFTYIAFLFGRINLKLTKLQFIMKIRH